MLIPLRGKGAASAGGAASAPRPTRAPSGRAAGTYASPRRLSRLHAADAPDRPSREAGPRPDRRARPPVGQRYGPWGGRRESAVERPTDRLFTGQTYDDVSGLYCYRSRYYDANLGQFCQPDTVVPEAASPQTWSRYAHARNNPVTFSDPTGHDSYLQVGGPAPAPLRRGEGSATT